MIVKTKKKYTPSLRWHKSLRFFNNSFFFNINIGKKKKFNNIKHKKLFYKSNSLFINLSIFKYYIFITKKHIFKTKPYKKYSQIESLSGFSVVVPGIQNLNIGKILYNTSLIPNTWKNITFSGFIVFLKNIPINVYFSNILDIKNIKITYVKSSGTYCKMKRIKKSKKKLLPIQLPSGTFKYLTKITKSYIGKNQNFNINSLNEGKFGFSFSKTKKISVRGVAMNPVDHPNGGRTKTVQPERSPWNWIAKRKK